MQKSDIDADPLVQETLKVFKETIEESYKDPNFLDRVLSAEEKNDNPVLDLLAETDALDSVIAAVVVADRFRGWIELSRVAPKLDGEVAAVLKLLDNEDFLVSGPAALLDSGNPAALKLVIATVASMMTGKEFEEMKADANPVEMKMALAQVGGLMTDLAEQLSESGKWAQLPPRLLDRYLDGMTNLADLSTSKAQKRVMTEVIQDLKAEVAKATAQEIAEKTPAQIDPNSPFAQLRQQAKKFKL